MCQVRKGLYFDFLIYHFEASHTSVVFAVKDASACREINIHVSWYNSCPGTICTISCRLVSGVEFMTRITADIVVYVFMKELKSNTIKLVNSYIYIKFNTEVAN